MQAEVLHTAVKGNQPEAVIQLLDQGIAVYAQDKV